MRSAGLEARAAGVSIATGDTKVIERRGQPGITINTAGVGVPLPGARLGFDRVGAGDAIILSGPLGLHGLAVMCRREGLSIGAALESDCASLHRLTQSLIQSLGQKLKWMRDPTRGGLAATLAELSAATGRCLEIREADLPTHPTARAAADLLGLDLLSVANEGKLVAVVAEDAADQAVETLARHELARAAAAIGAVGAVEDPPLVEMITRAGGRRVVQMPYGEQLPRIC